jgi:hypothetical protein
MNEITDEGIHRNHAFRFELAQRDVDRPLVRAYGVQAVIREVDIALRLPLRTQRGHRQSGGRGEASGLQ